VFTDADCMPADDWLERGVAHLRQHPDVGLVAGKIEVVFRNGEPRSIPEWIDSEFTFPQELFVNVFHFGATANLFTFRRVIQKVGPFNAALKSGGDVEWGQRVYAAGYILHFAGEARIRHPAMDTTRQHVKKAKRVSGGYADMARL